MLQCTINEVTVKDEVVVKHNDGLEDKFQGTVKVNVEVFIHSTYIPTLTAVSDFIFTSLMFSLVLEYFQKFVSNTK